MKRVSLALVLAVVFGAVSFAQVNYDFTLVNKTGIEIYEVYVSPSDVEDWQEDVLGVDTLPTGKSVEITFDSASYGAAPKKWDLRVVDGAGKDYIWFDLDLATISELTLTIRSGKGYATWK